MKPLVAVMGAGLTLLIVLAWLGSCFRGASQSLRAHAAPVLDAELWDAFKHRFVSGGRVVDADSDSTGVTHSESQGYGMLLAEAAADRATFEALWAWSRRTLQRADFLFAWRFGPCEGEADDCVSDFNNATDGDVLIAWALLRAADRWGDAEYRAAAGRIVRAIEKLAVVRHHGRLLLLPGVSGFGTGDTVTVNLSYWVFPAFEAFAAASEGELWRALQASGYELIREGRFGKWNLPPDWVDVTPQGLRPSTKFEPRYGFDAVRIPLYVAWSRRSAARLLDPFFALWEQSGPHTPAWVDLVTDDAAPYSWSTGAATVAAVARRHPPGHPGLGPSDGYYSWSLTLLANVAAAESPP